MVYNRVVCRTDDGRAGAVIVNRASIGDGERRRVGRAIDDDGVVDDSADG